MLGVGGGAGNATHAVNDFRKIGGFEAYAPTDNVSELTARVNDDGWESVFVNWLKGSKLGAADGVVAVSYTHLDVYKRQIDSYLDESVQVAGAIDKSVIEKAVQTLLEVRESGGRLFVLGVGGGAGNATHAAVSYTHLDVYKRQP